MDGGEALVLATSEVISHVQHPCREEASNEIILPDPLISFTIERGSHVQFDSVCIDWVLC